MIGGLWVCVRANVTPTLAASQAAARRRTPVRETARRALSFFLFVCSIYTHKYIRCTLKFTQPTMCSQRVARTRAQCCAHATYCVTSTSVTICNLPSIPTFLVPAPERNNTDRRRAYNLCPRRQRTQTEAASQSMQFRNFEVSQLVSLCWQQH